MFDILFDVIENTTTIREIDFVEMKKLANDVQVEIEILLSDSDWTQLVDAPITYTKKLEWREYRQALRDLLASSAFPDVELPEKPE
ncbi:MAG: phage tail assembly chaperone [Bacillota bacterium]